MENIIAAKAAIVDFFCNEFDLPKEAVQVIGLAKKGEEWRGTVIVTQTNHYLRSLGYPSVYDRTPYSISLDRELNILQYMQSELEKEED